MRQEIVRAQVIKTELVHVQIRADLYDLLDHKHCFLVGDVAIKLKAVFTFEVGQILKINKMSILFA